MLTRKQMISCERKIKRNEWDRMHCGEDAQNDGIF
jgi:hypothetical protein